MSVDDLVYVEEVQVKFVHCQGGVIVALRHQNGSWLDADDSSPLPSDIQETLQISWNEYVINM